MKEYYRRLQASSRYGNMMKWTRLISVTGSSQVIVQLAGLACGILIIRLLPTSEYALYTLANTMLGTMTVLADGGISSGVMSQGGKVWQDKEKLGVILATGLALRRKFAIASLALIIPILGYLLWRNGAGWVSILLITIALVPAFLAALSDALLEIIPKLHQDIKPLQQNQMSVSIGRLVLSAVSIFIFPWTFIAILANGFPRLYGNIRLRKIAYRYVDANQVADPAVRGEMLKIVKHLLPTAIYYCFSGQITVWLISIWGSSMAVAQIGALGRLSVLLTLFTTLFGTLIVPRYARLQLNQSLLLKSFFKIQAGLIFVCAIIILGVWLFPVQLLWLLGSNYAGLNYELLLSIIASCVGLCAGSTFSLYVCRGWVISSFISIPINILAILAGVVLFNVTSLQGVLLLNIFTNMVQYIMNMIFITIKIKRAA